MSSVTDYEFAVIGGGSGGIAAAIRAAAKGVKTVLFDYVTPTSHGTKWGLGGTCVNVGCVPKKIMHFASQYHHWRHDASKLGWTVESKKSLDWETLVNSVQNTVKRLNFSYRASLRTNNVTYINALATFLNPTTLQYIDNDGNFHKITAEKILIAVGGRPSLPGVEGEELAITSDDFFGMKSPPNKTLVIGGSYIALETAGILNGLGFPTTLCIRSVPLRMYDRQCAEKVLHLMVQEGVKVRMPHRVLSIKQHADGKLVTYDDGNVEIFDTVIAATGRIASTSKMNLNNVNITPTSNGKLQCIEGQTSIPNIYAVGDVVHKGVELTPVAIKTAEKLVDRLFGDSNDKSRVDCIPSTVFTPYEYSFVGMSEEEAIGIYGSNDIEVYLQEHTTLEIEACHREKVVELQTDLEVDMPPVCLVKMICLVPMDNKILGLHFIGPNAGEIMQGFAVAMQMGAKKRDFDDCIGIHPTDAEAFVNLHVSKSSGQNWIFGGCGGGKCG